MKILHIYPMSIEYAYPAYQDPSLHPDRFDEDIVCNTDLEVRYLTGMQKLGEDCVLFYPTSRKLPVKEFIHRGGYRMVRFPVSLFPGKTGREYSFRMFSHIRKEKPDIIHYHHIYGGGKFFYFRFFVFVAVYCRLKRIPLAGWYHVGSMKRGKKAHIIDKIGFLGKLEKKLRILPLELCAGISSINHNELERLFNPDHPEHYGLDLGNKPNLHTPNTYNPEIFFEVERETALKKTGLDERKKYFIIIARLFPLKGLHHLIDAFYSLKKEFEGIELLVIGEFEKGTSDYKKRIEEQISNLDLKDSVKFPGRIEHHQGLVYYLNAAEAFVLPTLKDSFAAVNIEAMACGIPVISSNVEEIPYYLKPEVGILINPGKVEELYIAMKKIITGDFQLNHEIRREILRNYDYFAAAGKLRDWYKKLIINA